MILGRLPEWTAAAACAGLTSRAVDWWAPDADLPDVEQGFQLHLARRVCAGCPVRTECARQELELLPQFEPVAMRGGLTPDELVALARALGLPYRRAAQCGTRSKYVGGCRCGDCTNANRVYEHERRLKATSPSRIKRPVVLTPRGAVSARLSKHGRTARTIATATGMKTRVVRTLLEELRAGNRAAVVGVSAAGAPLWARPSVR